MQVRLQQALEGRLEPRHGIARSLLQEPLESEVMQPHGIADTAAALPRIQHLAGDRQVAKLPLYHHYDIGSAAPLSEHLLQQPDSRCWTRLHDGVNQREDGGLAHGRDQRPHILLTDGLTGGVDGQLLQLTGEGPEIVPYELGEQAHGVGAKLEVERLSAPPDPVRDGTRVQGAELPNLSLALERTKEWVTPLNLTICQHQVRGRRHPTRIIGERQPGGGLSRRLPAAAAAASGAGQPRQKPLNDHQPVSGHEGHRIAGGPHLHQAGLAAV